MLSPLPLKSSGRILVVDQEITAGNLLRSVLTGAGFKVEIADCADLALQLLDNSTFDIILCDHQIPATNGRGLLQKLTTQEKQTTVIVMSDSSSSEAVIEAIKLGAYDYISKPLNTDEILLTIRKAQERERLRNENEILKSQVSRRYSFSNIIAKSPGMSEIFETIKKISDYKTTIMLYGESGTGKELIAKAIHYNSCRAHKQFIPVNCGAIPENLLESELFGHKRGAFTDAIRDKKGLFEEADGGTLLLDEVGEMPLHLQVKLLRVLQENEIRPVGEEQVIPINVRIIAATLRDLETDVIEGRFREDLYYRLNVISVQIPPLRERKDDIPLLINYFIKKNQEKLGLTVYGISKDALSALIDHDWPGNIRELENCIERAMILTEGEEISRESLPKSITSSSSATSSTILPLSTEELSIKLHSRILEETLIKRALERTFGNRTHAAKLLEISHRTLLYKLKEYNLTDVDSTD